MDFQEKPIRRVAFWADTAVTLLISVLFTVAWLAELPNIQRPTVQVIAQVAATSATPKG